MGSTRKQFEDEQREGRMIHIKMKEARARYGERLRIAPQGAIGKTNSSGRVLHDGTHGAGVKTSDYGIKFAVRAGVSFDGPW